MAYYPLFIDAEHIRALVVGAGSVGARKARSLCKAGAASVLVVDPEGSATLKAELAAFGRAHFFARAFTLADLDDVNLVFVASGDRAVNAQVAEACAAKGILCNSADAPRKGAFIVPAHFSVGDMVFALSTGGKSPALARVLREELEAFVGTRYTRLLNILEQLRPLVLDLGLPADDNAAIFRRLVRSSLCEHLAAHNDAAALCLLQELLPRDLHPHLGDLLHGN